MVSCRFPLKTNPMIDDFPSYKHPFSSRIFPCLSGPGRCLGGNFGFGESWEVRVGGDMTAWGHREN